MRNTGLPQRYPLDERIKIAVAPDQKRRVFKAAASRGLTVSEFLRALIAEAFASEDAAKAGGQAV